MGDIVDLVDKIKRYYKFTPSETVNLVVSILIVAFIVSFNDWDMSSIFIGLRNLFNAVLIVGLTFLVHDAAQRISGLQAGFRVEYKMSTFGLIASLVIVFVSRGRIWWVLIPGGILIHHMAGHRLGWWRYGLNYFAQGMIAMMGPIANMVLALFFRMVAGLTGSPLVHKAMVVNIAFALCTMLPIPPLNGSRALWGSRLTYSFALVSMVGAAVLLFSPLPGWIVIIGSLLIGFIGWLAYYVFFERTHYRGPG